MKLSWNQSKNSLVNLKFRLLSSSFYKKIAVVHEAYFYIIASLLLSGGNYDNLRRTADMAVILTKSGGLCGLAYLDVIARGMTLGVVKVNTYDKTIFLMWAIFFSRTSIANKN